MPCRPPAGYFAPWRVLRAYLAALALSGCVVNLTGGLPAGLVGTIGTSQPAGSLASASTSASGQARRDDSLAQTEPLTATEPLANVTPLAGTVTGVVVDERGNPARNVAVTAYLRDTAALANVTPLTAAEPLANVTPYRRIQSESQALTDEKGVFTLRPSATGTINVEAVAGVNRKAWRASIAFSDTLGAGVWAGTLALAPTGTITGKVTAPQTQTVRNFQGVDVYIPGSSYVAKADASGAYTLLAVAAGSFNLAAEKSGLGRAFATGVEVKPRATTVAPDLALSLTAPEIAAIVPRNAGPGASVEITGKFFGASTGDPFHVTFDGIEATEVTRRDDGRISVAVPKTATTGDVLVRVGDVSSNPVAFQVVKRIALSPTAADLLIGASLRVEGSILDTAGAPVADPAIVWSVAGASLSLVPKAVGVDIAGVEPGDATVSATSGTVAATASIHAFRILGVELSPASATLNALPPEGEPEIGFATEIRLLGRVLASDGTTRKISWESSDPALATVTAGLVRSTRAGREGSCEIVARAADDPRHFATASVVVTILGKLNVGID